MHLKLMDLEKIIFDSQVTKVNVPGYEGAFQIFKQHAPMISLLTQGKIKAFYNGKTLLEYDIIDGILKVKDNEILILL